MCLALSRLKENDAYKSLTTKPGMCYFYEGIFLGSHNSWQN